MKAVEFIQAGFSGRRLLAVALLVVIGAGLGLHHATPTLAQRPGTGGNVDQVFRSFATRLVVPVLEGAGRDGATNVLKLVSSGWKPTTVLVVEVNDAPSGTACATEIPTSRYGKIRCLTLPPLTPMDVDVELESGHLLLYSISAAGIVDACTSFGAVKNGSKTLEAWERETWSVSPGEPLAATLFARTSDAVTSLPGRVTGFAIRGQGGMTGGANPATQIRAQALPLVWSGAGTNVDLFNANAACATVNHRIGAANASECRPATGRETTISPLTTAKLPIAADGALGLSAPIDVVASVDHRDASGWLSYSGFQSGAAESAGQLAFPLAVGDFPNWKSELWVTNQHLTATAQIDILMWDGNGQLKVYKDPQPLCPGGVKMYDIHTIAGTIEPTRSGRGTVDGPPMLSLRVESTNLALPAAPPISGLMVLRSDWGVTAYPAMNAGSEMQALQLLGRARAVQPYTIVPNVKINVGMPARSTLLAVQNLSEPATPFMALDFYDSKGQLVAGNVQLPVGGQGLVGSAFVDLGRFAGRRLGGGETALLPASFEGFVVIRGQQNYGLLGVVAVDVPHVGASQPSPGRTPLAQPDQGTGGDSFLSWTGILLPRWPNPDVPTPTAGSTPMRPTPGPGTGTPMRPTPGGPTPGGPTATPMRPIRMTPTPTPAGEEPTPTANPQHRPIKLLLPALWNNASGE